MNSPVRLLLTLGVAGLLAGCSTVPAYDPAVAGPFFAPRNFTGDKQLPAELRRVVVLPVAIAPHAPGETGRMLDAVIVKALQQRQRFELVTPTREELRVIFGAEEFASGSLLPHGMFERLAQHYAADGVLFVDVTVYQPYRPQAIGFRAKLASLRESRLHWAFDEVISAADPAVANSARRHALTGDRILVPVDLSPVVLQSPGRFGEYVASEMFATLPPR